MEDSSRTCRRLCANTGGLSKVRRCAGVKGPAETPVRLGVRQLVAALQSGRVNQLPRAALAASTNAIALRVSVVQSSLSIISREMSEEPAPTATQPAF